VALSGCTPEPGSGSESAAEMTGHEVVVHSDQLSTLSAIWARRWRIESSLIPAPRTFLHRRLIFWVSFLNPSYGAQCALLTYRWVRVRDLFSIIRFARLRRINSCELTADKQRLGSNLNMKFTIIVIIIVPDTC
jgi:hypothetical protein